MKRGQPGYLLLAVRRSRNDWRLPGPPPQAGRDGTAGAAMARNRGRSDRASESHGAAIKAEAAVAAGPERRMWKCATVTRREPAEQGGSTSIAQRTIRFWEAQDVPRMCWSTAEPSRPAAARLRFDFCKRT